MPLTRSLKSLRPAGGRATRALRPRATSAGRTAASAFSFGPPSFSPRRRTLVTLSGGSKFMRPLVPNVAQPAKPVASMTVRTVSRPSPNNNGSPSIGSARRTTPPLHGPSDIFCSCFSTCALPLPLQARKVRCIPPTGAPVLGLVGSAMIAGKYCPFGCTSLGANRRQSGGGSGGVIPRDWRYVSTRVPVIGCAWSQIARASSGVGLALAHRRRGQTPRTISASMMSR